MFKFRFFVTAAPPKNMRCWENEDGESSYLEERLVKLMPFMSVDWNKTK